MYTVKNLASSSVNTPYADFAPLEEKQFQQDLKGNEDAVAYAFFMQSAQFLVTGGDYENPGAKGDPGVDGKTILNGVIPPVAQGINGDFYLDTAANVIYGPKAAGVWPVGVSLVGATGLTGPSITYLHSGLIAGINNTASYGVNIVGGSGQATPALACVMIQEAGSLSALKAKADVAVDGLASVNVTVFKNGVATALTVTIAAADTTTLKTSAGPVAVVAGDLITFEVDETAAVAPVANFQAAVKFTKT